MVQIFFSENIQGNESYLPPSQREAFYEKMKVLVVEISSTVNGERFKSSGVILRPRHVLTCCHCAQGRVRVRKIFDDKFVDCMVRAKSRVSDLAYLYVPDWDDDGISARVSGNYNVCGEIHSISHPRGLLYSYNVGQIAHPCRQLGDIDSWFHKIDRSEKSVSFIQHQNLHLSSGSSGSPVFDSRGQLIGISQSVIGNKLGIIITMCEFLKLIMDASKAEDGKEDNKDFPSKRRKSFEYVGAHAKGDAIAESSRKSRLEEELEEQGSSSMSNSHRNLGYYHNPETGLYFHGSSGTWFSLDEVTCTFTEAAD